MTGETITVYELKKLLVGLIQRERGHLEDTLHRYKMQMQRFGEDHRMFEDSPTLREAMDDLVARQARLKEAEERVEDARSL